MSARTLTAVALCAGFYLTGLAVIVVLGALPWAQLRYAGELRASGILALIGIGYLLWGLAPRWEGWTAPGPELDAADHPRLFAVLGRIAAGAAHPLPRAVYLVPSVSAFAGGRPRWLGLRRDPMMGLGLPVFAFLSEAQLAAVIGHEFGHHASGDVRLGPWQHRTYRAIAHALHRLDGSNLFLHLPFYAYGRLYLRFTSPASREQELRADALAARLAGARELGSALIAFEAHAPLWASYWSELYLPAVEEGFRLPLLEGYRRFLSSAPARTRLGRSVAELSTAPDPDDTHPSLEQRLQALGVSALRGSTEAGDARGLFDDASVAEDLLLAALFRDPARLGQLTRVEWEEWADVVVPRVWARGLEAGRPALGSLELGSLPEVLAEADAWWHRLHRGLNVFSAEARRRQVRSWLARWAAHSLLAAGYRLGSGPGDEPVLERDGLSVEPFRWVEDLAAARRTPDEWRALCARAGL